MTPVHLRWRLILLVGLGGAVGTGLREGLALTWPAAPDGFPVTVFVINVVGAFALGLLVETLGRRGDDSGPRRLVRLAVGTGVLGGFTTYSSLATDAASRLPHVPWVAFAYAAATLVVGALAAFAGFAVGSAAAPRPQEAARRVDASGVAASGVAASGAAQADVAPSAAGPSAAGPSAGGLSAAGPSAGQSTATAPAIGETDAES